MAPLWLITIVTMVGTTALMYAWHRIDLQKQHAANMQEIASVTFRTDKYDAYYKTYVTKGKAVADADFKTK